MDQFFIYPKPVIEIRSKYYVSVLLSRLGVERVANIPRALDELAGDPISQSCKKYRNDFFRYWSGGNIKNRELVSAVDELLPGTARILHHPIWALLSGSISDKKALVRLGQAIETGLQQYILQYDENTGNICLLNQSGNWRLLRAGSSFLKLINRRGLDELAALLILMRAHERLNEFSVSYFFMSEMHECLSGIRQTKEFEPIFAELYNIILHLYCSS